ncbi:MULTISPECIES: shikimate kinase [unclassified Paracoccus (in: a-proteobacteria)]|uniref:shikimate kinase n=1 Tax=unclassified Paracoccus (in: a-proteobacteria) TaxID=2688777 RepID=UPI0012B34271|nr:MULTISPECIES: shikimate kinase [unclassified Paracoccus (in: a-proteobacteria)]UXU74683.1 shikimate kinase [Paracoccus sp. SMMA_5]UXU80578.1 shikimate kinase [Paracoccus sp. SMMA_5_TC]
MRRNIVLIGMMGAGKTAIGSELSRRLHRPFTDIDAEIERAAAMTIPEIFARDGEEFFRARESEILARVLQSGSGIVSTGGGAWMRPQNRETIDSHGLAVWLDCDLETLWQRVKGRPTRPLLQTPDPRGTLERLLNERRPVYELATIRVPARRGDSIDQTTNRVMDAIRAHDPAILEAT